MKISVFIMRPITALVAAICLLLGDGLAPANAGVTIITHGLNGNVDGWVSGMASNIPNYFRFPGTNFTAYRMYFYFSAGSYYLTAERVAGSNPISNESGEIIIKLDWRELADGNTYNTFQVAGAVAPALMNTNFIPELGGHALAEFPLHLIGHSRGGSLVSEVSRLLGTNGVWVDHMTTLDPHPLNDPAFPLDQFAYSAVDAPANTYENVVFHDNYWQDLGFFVYGKSVAGAYVRKLLNLDGGYTGTSGPHSDVHLWYHGTIDLRNPADDTEKSITSAERNSWWSSYEAQGVTAGFNYSLIGRGDRTSSDRPVGSGGGMIRDGFNQWWDLGAGTSNNRMALPANNGNWPNLIKFNRATTNQVVQGQTMSVTFYWQWAKPASSLATIGIYLDDDLNPLNENQTLVREVVVPATGASSISFATTNLTVFASNAAPGYHAVLGKITGGGRSRFFYAPELVEIIPVRLPPTLDVSKINSTQYRIGVEGLPGQVIVLQNSTNLQMWSSLATNTLTTNRWVHTNTPASGTERGFYRALLP